KGKQGTKAHELTISTVGIHKGPLLSTFEEIADRTAAVSLRGVKFFAQPLEDEEDDGFYDHELDGRQDGRVGEVMSALTGITHGPVPSLLEAKLDNGKEALIPFVEEIVTEVDLEEGTCTITPPEGLLDL